MSQSQSVDSLTGRVALVTGASSGIGEATAVAMAQAGAAVTLGARRIDRLESLAARLRDDGARVLTLELDVTDESACREAVQRTRTELGGLDVLVNSAGLMLLGPIIDADTEDWRRMISTNVLGLMYMTHAAAPIMVEQGSGEIVNISSVAGRQARSGVGVYNASKWAVNAFSESLRQEVTERGVRVFLVEPGAVATELTDHITDRDSKQAPSRCTAPCAHCRPKTSAGSLSTWSPSPLTSQSTRSWCARPTRPGSGPGVWRSTRPGIKTSSGRALLGPHGAIRNGEGNQVKSDEVGDRGTDNILRLN